MFAASPDLVNTKSQSYVGREWSLDDEEFELLAEEIGRAPTRSEIRKWPKELKDKRKMQLHCRRMLRFRTKRAAEKKTMKEKYLQLEQELEQQLVKLRQRGRSLSLNQVQREMQRLALEREVLREESVSLRQETAKYERFLRIIQSTSGQVVPEPRENDLDRSDPMSQCGVSKRNGSQYKYKQVTECTSTDVRRFSFIRCPDANLTTSFAVMT